MCVYIHIHFDQQKVIAEFLHVHRPSHCSALQGVGNFWRPLERDCRCYYLSCKSSLKLNYYWSHPPVQEFVLIKVVAANKAKSLDRFSSCQQSEKERKAGFLAPMAGRDKTSLKTIEMSYTQDCVAATDHYIPRLPKTSGRQPITFCAAPPTLGKLYTRPSALTCAL